MYTLSFQQKSIIKVVMFLNHVHVQNITFSLSKGIFVFVDKQTELNN